MSQSKAPMPANELLGSLVLEKPYGPKSGDITLLVVGFVFTAMAVGNFVFHPTDWKTLIIGGLGLVCAGMGGWPLLRNPRWFFYQKGLIERTRWDETTILYQEVAELTCVSTRILINFQYHHTAIEMQLRPRSERRKIKIQHTFKEKLAGATKDRARNVIEQVRDLVAQNMADRMFRELKYQSSVPWAAGVSIRRDGLDITSRNGSVQSCTWQQVQGGLNSQAGVFFIVIKGIEKPAATIPMKAPNFFPGYVLLKAAAEAEGLERL
jgi:hypothetical protein